VCELGLGSECALVDPPPTLLGADELRELELPALEEVGVVELCELPDEAE
jgi:hypothetical protein